MSKIRTSLPPAAAMLLLAACGGGGGDATGDISIAVTDAPVDSADAVWVQFSGVELKPQGGPAFMLADFGPPRRINLLELQSGVSEQLIDATVPAGRYNWIRLAVDAEQGDATLSSIVIAGAEHPLWVPSGDETGLKLVSGVVVPAGGQADFTIDFDLRKSVHLPNDGSGDYMLRPALRLLDNTEVGAVAGTVAASLLTGDECSVYVFAGDVTPDDVDGTDPDPVTSAAVVLDADSGEWRYHAAFLLAGPYTLAPTCDAASDDPAVDDAGVGFIASEAATAVANEVVSLDFTG
jgi:hypothetical protein